MFSFRKFEDDLGFNYDLIRSEDPKWGTFEVGEKNSITRCITSVSSKVVSEWTTLLNTFSVEYGVRTKSIFIYGCTYVSQCDLADKSLTNGSGEGNVY